MGTMTDVDHGTWNMQALAMCGRTLDLKKLWNFDFEKHCGDHLVTPQVNFLWAN